MRGCGRYSHKPDICSWHYEVCYTVTIGFRLIKAGRDSMLKSSQQIERLSEYQHLFFQLSNAAPSNVSARLYCFFPNSPGHFGPPCELDHEMYPLTAISHLSGTTRKAAPYLLLLSVCHMGHMCTRRQSRIETRHYFARRGGFGV